jgi:uncharacterized protein (TIGR00266 family)
MPVFDIVQGRDPLLSVELKQNEAVIAESNAMVMMDAGVSIEGHMQGGFLSSLARNLFSKESFFQQVARANKGRDGQILLAPQLPGDIEILKVGEVQYFLNSGAFMASDEAVRTVQKMNSNILGAFFGSVGGFVIMKTEGQGTLCLSGFGQIIKVNVTPNEPIIVDNGHVVAWDTRLNYEVSTASSSRSIFGRMASTAMSGEFLVTKFSGEGVLYICSRNQTAFEGYIRSLIPQNPA